MLHSLKGILVDFEQDYAVIDVGGVRFQVEIPASTAGQFGAAGSETEVFTRLSFNTNDGTFSLFGFATTVERDCFDILTSMSGIGPRKALGILSQIEIAAFAHAIVNRDIAYVSKIKGVGKKTAERLIVELREKMVPFIGLAPSAAPAANRPENVGDAIEAMMALGCKQVTAERAIAAALEILGSRAGTGELVKEGLRHR